MDRPRRSHLYQAQVGQLIILSWLAAACLSPAAEEPELWSLRPVKSAAPPAVADSSWPRTDVDRFILAKLEAAKLKPAPDADRATLVRRLYFTLVGLPPTLEELSAEKPIEALVDELLASPRFGEKWGRHWLDLARYAESNGRDRDVIFPHAWRYRDYVIASLNADKPYDRFIREQVAGDLLPDAGDAQKVATAFLALGPKSFQETDAEKFRLDVVDEQIDVLSRSVLGLTVACARCHDHKFDPIPTADYYALAGIFLSSETGYGPGPLYTNTHEKDTTLTPIGPRVAELHPTVDAWRRKVLELTEFVTQTRSAAYRIRRQVTGDLRDRGLTKPADAPDLLALDQKCEAMYAEAKQKNEERLALIAAPPAEQPGYTMAVRTSEKVPADCQIRVGGMPASRGKAVARGTFTIPGMPAWTEIGESESGRLQLAEWLASEQNPLTARVMVNRVWYQLFGRGLVTSLDNFGVMGEEPIHPELLDHLASEFMADGWSVKRLIQRLVLSRAWQLSSAQLPANAEIDPDNALVWRAHFRRLDVEAFRDAVLSVSGQLMLEPPTGSLMADVYAGLEYGSGDGDNRAKFQGPIANFRHRTVYLPVLRNELAEVLQVFDFADPSTPIGARNVRTIPAQALFLMNSDFMQTQARHAAARLLKLEPAHRLETAYRLTTGKSPAPEIRQRAEAYLAGGSTELDAWTDLMQSLFASAPFRYLE